MIRRLKYSLPLILLIITGWLNTQAQTNFCSSNGTSQNYEWMYAMKLSTSSSFSDGQSFDLGSSTRTGYKDWTSTTANTFAAGSTVYYEIKMNSTSTYNQQIYFWLDKNQDGSLVDPGERVHATSKSVNGVTTHTGSFTMPAAAEIGSGTVFGRIIMRYSSAPPLCGSYDYGTTFDFRINVTGGTLNVVQSTITVNVSGSGTVTSNPAGINTSSSQTANFSPNKSVSLTATGSSGQVFSHWTGTGISGTSTSNPLTFTTGSSNETRNYTAVFTNPCQAATTPGTATGTATSQTAANLSWTASTGTSPITYYWNVKRTADNVSVASGNTTGTSASTTALTANTAYYLEVYASNCGGNSGSRKSANFTTYPLNPGGVTASFNPVCSGNATTLTASGAQGTVYWYTGSCGGTYIGTGNSITVNPSVNTTYYARNNNGNWSPGCASATVTVNYPASAPTQASATPTGTSTADLSFSGSTGTGTITYYWVVGTSASVTYGNGVSQGSTTGPSATATGLSQSTTYYLRVYAQNSCGSSSYITSAAFRTHSVLTYVAGSNGSLTGNLTQILVNGNNGTAVTAVPDNGYNFVNWSDGRLDNPRTDTNVTSSATLTAIFAPNRLVFEIQPVIKKAGEMIPVSVRITDTYGNTMTQSSAEVTLAIESNPSTGGTGVLNGTKTVTAVNGIATFTDLWIDKTGTGYTLKASSPSPVVTQPVSASFHIIPNKLDHFTLSGIPSPHEAGETTSPTVTAYDIYNNVKYDYTGTVTFSTNNVSTSSDPAKQTLLPANYQFTPEDNGVKTFTNQVALKRYGSGFFIKVNDTDLTMATGQQSDIQVSSAGINYFRLYARPTAGGVQQEVMAGTSFSILAEVYDEFDNLKEDYTGEYDVYWTTTASPSPLGNPYVLPGNGPQSFTAGKSTISGFTLFNAQETPVITMTDGPTSSPGTTQPIVVQPEVLNNFLVEPAPAQAQTIGGVRIIANEMFGIKVTARDQYNNIQRNYAGNIRFKSSNDNVFQYPQLLQSFASYNGIRTFENMFSVEKTGEYWLRVADSQQAFRYGDLQNIIVAPSAFDATASRLAFASDPATPFVAGDYVTVQITPMDAGGNLLCDCQDVAVYLNGELYDWDSHPGAIPVTVNHDGTYTATIRVTQMGLNTITASVDGVNLINQLTIEVDQTATPAYFAIAGDPTQVAGTFQTISIEAYDQFNNLVTNYNGDKMVRFTGADPSPAPSTNPATGDEDFGKNTTVHFANGKATVDMWLYKAETAIINATEITGGTAGGTDGQSHMAITDNGLTVSVTPAVANYLAVTGNPTQTAGYSQAITVTAYDNWNNVATGYSGSHSIIFSGASVSPGSPKAAVSPDINGIALGMGTGLNFSEGVASGTMTLTRMETANIRASDGTIHTSDDYGLIVVVSHGDNDYFTVTGSSTQTAGVAQTITITMYDAYNNIATSFGGEKSLIFAGAEASLYGNNPTVNGTHFGTSTTVAFNNGVASSAPTASMVLTKAETTHVTVSGDGINTATGFGLTVNVIHNTATNLRIDTQPSAYVRAGDPFAIQPVISVRDAYGNSVANDNSTEITASINQGTETLHGLSALTVSGGYAAFNGLNYKKMETISIDFNADPVLTTVTSDPITVDHNATTKLVYTQNPAFIYAGGQRGQYTVTRYDAYDNLVNNVVNADGSDDNIPEPVYLYSSNSHTSSRFFNSVTGGSQITSANIMNGSSSATFWYYTESSGNHLITASDKSIPDDPDSGITNATHVLEVRPAALSHFIVSGIGRPVENGFTEHYYGDAQTVTVEAIDILGNRKTNYAGTITISLTDDLAQTGIHYPDDYTFTVGEGKDNGIHTFTNGVTYSRPSFEHPDPGVDEWWFTAVDLQSGKFGAQQKIRVIPRPVLITTHNQEKTYGDTHDLGAETFTVSSRITEYENPEVFAFNESITGLTLSSAGTPASATVGEYAITGTGGTGINGFNAAYYDIAYSDAGKLKVNPRPVTVTADTGQNKVYGNHDPAFTYQVTEGELVNGDSFAGMLSREPGENVDSYDLQQGTLTIVNGATNKYANYDVTFSGSIFEIKPLSVTVKADAQGKTYGDLDPALTFISVPAVGTTLANGEVIGFEGSLSREAGEHAGTYGIGQNDLGNANYVITYTSALLTINQLSVTVTADDKSKTYGDVDPALTFVSVPAVGDILANGQVIAFTGALSRAAGDDVGTYAIEQNDLANDNYAINYTGALLTIDPLAITVIADEQTKVYGQTDPVLTYQYAPDLIGPDTFTGALSRVPGEDAGTYAIGQGTLALSNNYSLNFTEGEMEITRLAIAVTADNQTKVYGQADPVMTYQYAPALIGSDAFTGTLSRVAGEDAGTYAIGQRTLALSDNYTLNFTAGEMEITRLAIAVTADNQTKVYGQADPVMTYQYAPALIGTDAFTGTLSRVAGEDAGTYAIGQGTLALSDNYTLSFTEGELEITRLAIAVTADNQTKVYGQADPALTYQFSPAMIGSDAFTGTLSREAGEDAGTYAIGQGTLALSDNYTLNFTEGEMEITRLAIAVTAENQTKVYGQADPELTYQYAPALIGTDAFTGALSREAGEAAGTYTIGQGTLALSNNYTLNFTKGELEITRLAIAVTADNQTKVYGQADPALTYQYAPALIGTDAFTGALSRVPGEDAGTYTIGQGTLALSNNYTLSFTEGEMEITRLAIAVTADNQTKVYGQADPVLTYQYAPALIGTDAFTGALSRVPGEDAGTYTIGQGSLALSNNYTLSFTEGEMEITRLAVAVTAEDQTKVYGQADPALTYQFSPALIGTDAFTGALSRVPGEDAGTYAVGQGTLALSDNYTLSFTEGELEITRLAISVTADNQTKVYGQADPALTYQFTPSLIGTDAFTGALSREAGEDAGTYNIGQGTLALSNNYTLSFTEGELEITRLSVVVTADAKSKVYGNDDPELTYQSDPEVGTELTNGEVISFTGLLSRATGENVGSYTIGQGSVSNSNYDITFNSASLTITPRAITIASNNQTKTYGDETFVLGNTGFMISAGSLAYEEQINSVTLTSPGAAEYAGTGDYLITPSNASGINGFNTGNYQITYSNTGILTVTPRTLTLSLFGASDKVYDGTTSVTGTGWSDDRKPGDILSFTFDVSFEDKHAGNGKNVHYANIVITGGPDKNNYLLGTTAGVASANIYRRSITIAADVNQNKLTQETDPVLTYTVTSGSLGSGDAFAGSLERVSGEQAGNYPIHRGTLVIKDSNGLGIDMETNYNITYLSADFTIFGRPGDANCDGIVNILDVQHMINYVLLTHEGDFCFGNADVIADNTINILDIQGVINIILNPDSKNAYAVSSQRGEAYLEDSGILLRSDGTISAVEFELTGENLDRVDLKLSIPGFEMAASVQSGVLKVLVFSLNGNTIPAGETELISIKKPAGQKLHWGEIFGANLNARKVGIDAFNKTNDRFIELNQFEQAELKVYPNPAKGRLFIEFKFDFAGGNEVRITDLSGRTLLIETYQHYKHSNHMLDISGLSSGIYLLQVRSKDVIKTERVVVQ